jgi:hypothetical protein
MGNIMIVPNAADVAAVLDQIRTNLLDLKAASLGPEYSYASLPLCVIDAVYSIGVRYSSTQRTVENWCLSQHPPWLIYRSVGAPEHSMDKFVELLAGQNFETLAEHTFKNRQRTSSRGGILKAEAVYRFAKVLVDLRISAFGDTEDLARNQTAEERVRDIPGQGSGISFSYFFMLAGSPGFVKADRMICRFVARALKIPSVAPGVAQKLVVAASAELNAEVPSLTPRLLDHEIWKYQRRVERT